MKKRHVVSVVGTLGIAAMLLAGCAGGGSDGGDASTDPIKFPVIWGLTGPYAANGEAFMNGFNAAVDDINEAGGIDGRTIEVTPVDDKGDGTQAVSALTELTDSGYEPDAIVPGGFSAETLALLPVLADREIFSISSANSPNTNDPASYPYHFGVSYQQPEALRAIAQQMKADGVQTVAGIWAADASGDAYYEGFKAAAADAGIEIVSVDRPAPDALNFDVEFQRALSANPDAVYADLSSLDATSRVFSSRVTTGGTDTPFYVGTSASSFNLNDVVDPAALPDCSMPVFASTIEQADPPAYMDSWLTAAAKSSNVSAFVTGLGYDAARIFALAAERTGGDLSGAALADALTSEPIPADYLVLYALGTTYTPDNHFPSMPDGTFTTVPCDSVIVDGLWNTSGQ